MITFQKASLHLFIITLLSIQTVFSQNDILFLKNGSIYTGTLAPVENDTTISIWTLDNNLIVFHANEIKRIANDTILKSPVKRKLYPGRYYGLVNAGILAGSGNDQIDTPVSLHYTGTFLFQNHLSFGIGSGIEILNYLTIPLHADIRYYIPVKQGFSPYLYTTGGLYFPTNKKESDGYRDVLHQNGIFVNPGVGILLNNKNNSGIGISVGYRHQILEDEFEYDHPGSYNPTSRKYIYNRLSLHIAFIM
ncbi:MAG: hypothetical protein ACOC2F_07940 [Bacteroidota bacterium]